MSATECFTRIAFTQLNLLRLNSAIDLLLDLALFLHLKGSVSEIFYFPRLKHVLLLLSLFVLPPLNFEQSLFDSSETMITSKVLLLIRMSLYGLACRYPLLELFYFLDEAMLADFSDTILIV